MLNSLKKGFGCAVGVILGHAVLNIVSRNILKTVAKDDKTMERLKERKPDDYEFLKKYK